MWLRLKILQKLLVPIKSDNDLATSSLTIKLPFLRKWEVFPKAESGIHQSG